MQQPRHVGRPYDVLPADSLLTIRVMRAGPLAKMGHNHVVASHDLTGSVYVPPDRRDTTALIHLPVAELTIDEPALRAVAGTDFPPDVPDSARQGTRRNMLSEALLDGARYPEITLSCRRVTGVSGATKPMTPDEFPVQADIDVLVRGQQHTVTVPVRYELDDQRLVLSGEFSLRQTDLGLTPFSAALGGLQVQDEMRVSYRIVARAGRAN